MKTIVKNIPVDFSFIKNIEGEPQRYENDTGSMLMCLDILQAFQRKGGEDSSVNDIYLKLKQGAEEYAGERGAELIKVWVNIHLPQDYAQPHNHDYADFTSLYYIDVPEKSGNLFVQRPDKIEEIEPKKYDFIAIPGEFVHATGKNKSLVNRVSLVCDWNYLDTEKQWKELSEFTVSDEFTDAIEAANA